MKACLIQIESAKGDIARNIIHHAHWIEKAVAQKPDLIVFPELSLTGYEPLLAKDLATTSEDSRLNLLEELSSTYQAMIAVGLPIKTVLGVHIGMVIYQPKNKPVTYLKQMLHSDESPFFVPGTHQIILQVDNTNIAPAICFESLQEDHLEHCLTLNAHVYLASVCKHEKGIAKANKHFTQMAEKHNIPVLMVNSIGQSDNFMSAGQSSIWDSKGKALGQLNPLEEGMLYVEYAL